MTQNKNQPSHVEEEIYQELVDRYNAGELPWDSELPPPEVIDLIEGLSPGRALDLGCGYGRAAIYLAQRGWRVDAVDFIPQAIEVASERALAASVSDHIHFHAASVTDLNFLTGRYDFALDVGCLHILSEEGVQAYHKELLRLLSAGAGFLLFARLRDVSAAEDESPWGLTDAGIRALFADGFILEKSEHGETHVADQDSWASAWFWFRRAAS